MQNHFKADLLLMITAVIWGFSFVAQRAGMEYIGPFTYNGIRFFIGATVLLPILFFNKKKISSIPASRKKIFTGGIIAGVVLFTAASLQQAGMQFTTAGKAGFITGLYIIIVPFIGIFLKHKTGLNNWISAALATIGLYLLSGTDNLRIETGDGLILTGAFIWAAHILIISRFSQIIDPIVLSVIQAYICSAFSFCIAFFTESFDINNILDAYIPILYGGVLSIGIAFTLQVIGQKNTPPARASIIMSFETFFAALGGWLLLGETIPLKGLTGCLLMFAGIVLTQLPLFGFIKQNKINA